MDAWTCQCALASLWMCTLLLVFVPVVMHNAAMDLGEYCVLWRVKGESLTSFLVSFFPTGRDIIDWLIQKYNICEEGTYIFVQLKRCSVDLSCQDIVFSVKPICCASVVGLLFPVNRTRVSPRGSEFD